MVLPPDDDLEVVATPLLAAADGVDRLAVVARGGAGVAGLLRRANVAAEPIADQIKGAVAPPTVEVPPVGAAGRKVLREIPPLGIGADDIEDGVDDVPQVGLVGPPPVEAAMWDSIRTHGASMASLG
jgi:hypothetical protein